ncbi:MAG: N-acetylmuramoyl-L-alanine amidase [Acidobacteriota bacterium]
MKTSLVGFHLVLASMLVLLMAAPSGSASLPSRGFSVAIDIGHTRRCGGAVSARGVDEYVFNRRMGELVQGELIRNGFPDSFMINPDGSDISLESRPVTASMKKADLFLSIHHDSVQPEYLTPWECEGKKRLYTEVAKGFSIFYSERSAKPRESLDFATLLGTELTKGGLAPSLHHAEHIKGEGRMVIDREKGTFRFDDLVVLRTAKIPAVLLECGVILNRDEELSLNDPAYRKEIASAIVRAVKEFSKRESVSGRRG